jgi:hypothetical protein
MVEWLRADWEGGQRSASVTKRAMIKEKKKGPSEGQG